MAEFEDVTELTGALVSSEQIYRMFNRYHWTAQYAAGRDVLEVACGVGQGVGYIGRVARSVRAGDLSESILARARDHYGDRFEFTTFDAQDMPFESQSFDLLVMHEALYYVQDAASFVAEARRVLRPDGILLITNSNKDIADFNPSPHSTVYHGVIELGDLLAAQGFETDFWGSQPLSNVGLKQKLTRPLKRFAIRSGLMPRTMRGKEFLRRLVFGKLVPMPPEILPDMAVVETLSPLPGGRPCADFKILYARAKKRLNPAA